VNDNVLLNFIIIHIPVMHL